MRLESPGCPLHLEMLVWSPVFESGERLKSGLWDAWGGGGGVGGVWWVDLFLWRLGTRWRGLRCALVRAGDEGRGWDGGEDWDARVEICGLMLRAKRCVLYTFLPFRSATSLCGRTMLYWIRLRF